MLEQPKGALRNEPPTSQRSLREKKKRRVARLVKQQDDFLCLAAHEIRTPITVIKAQAQLAQRFHEQGKLTGEHLDRALSVFVQESDRLANLCNDLLDLARLDAGVFEPSLSRFDLVALIRAKLAQFRAQLKSSAHHLELGGPEEFSDEPFNMACPIECDEQRVGQMLTILVSNAIRFSPKGGRILVAIRRTADASVEISVTDEGLGLDPEMIENVFLRYYQAQVSGLKGPHGLGVGLYLCREIASKLGGTVRARSQGQGFGSEFTITLPIGRLGD